MDKRIDDLIQQIEPKFEDCRRKRRDYVQKNDLDNCLHIIKEDAHEKIERRMGDLMQQIEPKLEDI